MIAESMVKIVNDSKGNPEFLFHRFPMCPTANRLVAPVRGRLIATREKRAWENEVRSYHLRHHRQINQVKNTLADMKRKAGFLILNVDTYFVFPYSKLFTKDGRPKKLDANNRTKATLDAIATLTNIDDRYYFGGYCEKLHGESQTPYTIVQLKPMEAQNVKNAFSDLK